MAFKLTAACCRSRLRDRPLLDAARSGLSVAIASVACRSAALVKRRHRASRFAPPGARSAAKPGQGRTAAAARPIPDALKFANGLLRQKKYDLAAEEYERFIKSGVNGTGPG